MKKIINSIKNLFLLFLLIIFIHPMIRTQQCLPKLESLIEIGELKIKDFNKNNNQIELEFPVIVYKEGTAKFKVHSRESNLNYNGNIYQSKFEKEVKLIKDQNVKTTFSLETADKDNILISIFYEFQDAPVGYKKEYERYFKIIKNNNEYFILNAHEKNDLKPKEINLIKGSEKNA